MIGDVLGVGDVVVLDIPDENWSWGYHPVKKQKGTELEVTGFDEIAYSRIQNYGKEPGIYDNYSWVCLKGVEGSVSSCFLELKDGAEYKRRVKDFHNGKYEKGPIRPLPEMKFWEGDIVSINWSGRNPWKDETRFRVVRIDYEYLGRKRDDGSPMPEYTVECERGNSGMTAVNESDMSIISRGNVWKHFNGEKVEFKDIRQEADFFSMLGHTNDVRNPACNLYKWTKEEVLQAVRDGIVDGFTLSSIFGGEPRISAIHFHDRELGERVRKATMSGFDM